MVQAMRADAEANKLPPIYRGKWASASREEVQAMKDSGAPFCYRFRVPKVRCPEATTCNEIRLTSGRRLCLHGRPDHLQNKVITIQDEIRGEVSWNTDTLGDFVVLRSNGMPVYNFCVAIDDATMGITHVIRFAPGLHLSAFMASPAGSFLIN